MQSFQLGLSINCGFARVGIYELKKTSPAELRDEFRRSFSRIQGMDKPLQYWQDEKNKPLFLRHCDVVVKCFAKKWNENNKKKDYLDTFSLSSWKGIPSFKQKEHSLSQCTACAKEHFDLQKKFPLKPIFEIPDVVTVELCDTLSEGDNSRIVLQELNQSFTEKYGHSFTSSIVKYCGKSENIQERPSQAAVKKDKRKQKRNLSKLVSKQFSDKAAVTFLAENESFESYQRKRLEQSFVDTPKSRKKSHVPKLEKVLPYKELVLEEISNLCEHTIVNWSEIGRKCNIPGKKKGQIAKEIAIASGVDVTLFEKPQTTSRNRKSKAKFPGQEISMPSMPPPSQIKSDIISMLNDNILSLGELCCPHLLVKRNVMNGDIITTHAEVHGRKIPLLELRKKLLSKQEKFMRLLPDDKIQSLNRNELLSKLGEIDDKVNDNELRQRLKSYQRQRTLALWHDHSNIIGHGYILMTIHVVYDPAVFYTVEEYNSVEPKNNIDNIQSVIEEPELYMICLSSSSPSDQLATIADRIDCLYDLPQVITSKSGIELSDKLKFFFGDHPAKSFERGTQIGGKFKCGSCGCDNKRMDDFLSCEWRSLDDTYKIAFGGKFGKKNGILKPFDKLKKTELKEEFIARKIYDIPERKNDMEQLLHHSILRGVQRVPTILLSNTCQTLSDVNLTCYTVLDCEPLHDLKGHFLNLLQELPHILPKEVKPGCIQLLDSLLYSKKQSGYSGADVRVTLIEIFKYISRRNTNHKLFQLVSSAVQICQIFYSLDCDRTPKSVLKLYNLTWLHHELCKELFHELHELTHDKFFGLYLHSLVVHAPVQYEILSLRSVNTENQERIFQQAKAIAMATTNRKPENVIPSIMLRLQAKQIAGKFSTMLKTSESAVQKAAKETPGISRTEISLAFTENKLHSWQAHLQRISKYLVYGEGIWWKFVDNSYIFFDGEDEHYKPIGPTLTHFRSTSLKDVIKSSKQCWQVILDKTVRIPTTHVRIFDENGDVLSTQSFCINSAIEVYSPNPKRQCDYPDNSVIQSPEAFQENISSVPTSTPVDTEDVHVPQHHQSIMNTTPISNRSSGCRKDLFTVRQRDESNIEIDQTDDGRVLSHTSLKSKHAIAIYTATENITNDLELFDNLHIKLKQKCHPVSKEEYSRYQDVYAKLQLEVVKKRKELTIIIKKKEEDYYKKNGELPKDDVEYNLLCKKFNFIKKLLRKWNVLL